MVKKNVADSKVSLPFWSYVAGVVLALLAGIFALNELWAFYGFVILGLVISFIFIFRYKQNVSAFLIPLIGVIISLNGIQLVLSLTPLQNTSFSLFYVYVLLYTSIITIILSFTSLIYKEGEVR